MSKSYLTSVIRYIIVKFIIHIVLVVSFSFSLGAQDLVISTDSTEVKETSESSKRKRNTFTTVFNGKPGKAALYSLLLPAGGQIYNKKWWKVPLALGIEGGTIGWAIHSRQRFKKFDNIWSDLNNGIIDNEFNFTDPSQVVSVRRSARQQMEYSWVFILLGKLVTVFDAYVDRHLIEFDISEDLSYRMGSYPALKLSIPLNSQARKGKWVKP